MQERSESSALELAAECETEVLIRDSQDYTSRSWAQADGSIETEFAAEPQWVPDDTGEWIDADPTAEVAADGTLQPKATVTDLEFGSVGDTAFVTATNADGESVSLKWTEPLPEPVIGGDTVTYPEVMPDVDLEVYAGVADFSYALVVKIPEAAADTALERVELGLSSEGLSVAADAATDTAALSDADGEAAYSVDRPWMWDSSELDEGPGNAAPMELEIDADSLTVIPDQEFLADTEVEYPIYIDPKFRDENGASFENAFSQRTGITCGTGSEMCVGVQLWEPDNAYGYWRSAMKFTGLNSIANRDVQKANVLVTQTHTGGVGATHTVRLFAMNWWDFTGDTSMTRFSDQLAGLVATDSVPTSNGGESDQRIEWVDDRSANWVQKLVDSGNNTAVFGVISGSNFDQEKNEKYWRKLDPSTAKLVVWHAPLKPTKLLTNGSNCSTSAPGPTINTLTPTLKATAPASLRSTNEMNFYVYERNGVPDNHLRKVEVANVSAGASVTVTVPSGVLERGETYRWRTRAWDTDGEDGRWGDAAGYCYFRVNSLPTTPTSLQTENTACSTQQTAPAIVTTAAPDLSSIPADPDGGYVNARYQAYSEAGVLLKDWDVSVQSGLAAITTVTAADGLYRWRVLTEDAFASSAWSSYCWVRVDTTAPEPPDVVQVTSNPLPGGTAAFEFLGGADVKSFRYSFNGGAYQYVSASTGQADVSINIPATGSIDHTLEVWAQDFPLGSSGNRSSAAKYLFTAIATQPVNALAAWRFDGDLLDDVGGQHLNTSGSGAFGADAAGRAEAAAVFDGTVASCVTADGPLVDTTASVTMAAWVKIDTPADAGNAVLNVTGSVRSNLKLSATADGRWAFSAASVDSDDHVWTKAVTDTGVVEYGSWAHVAGVYDAPAERLRLYVDGELQASTELLSEPWLAEGVFSVGCGATADSSSFGWMTGSIDEAAAFQQSLNGEQIQDLMAGNGLPAALQAWYPLRGDGADASGRGADLTAMPATPTWLADQHGRAESALGFDGTVCPTAGAVPVRTDSSFTVSAWARLDTDAVNSHPRVFSFNGAQAFSVMAKYNAVSDKWDVGVTSDDSATPAWGDGAVSVEVATQEEWNQITVTVDPDNNLLQLFVNGELSAAGTIAADWDPWRAGEFVIGCNGRTDGTRASQWDGAISDVRVWRGALDAAEVAASHTEHLSSWSLGEVSAGEDEWGPNTLTFNGDYSWEVDRYNKCWAAYGLALGGTGWAETAGPVITTDESFTVTAWARVDDLSDYRTVVAQSGSTYGAFNLSYNPVLGRFQLSMPQKDAEETKWTRVLAQDAPVINESTGLGKWYHLAAQVDLGAGVIRLYVDGVLQGEATVVDSPWQATGPLTIGAAEQLGVMTNQMVGGIDQVQTWSGSLDALAIADITADRPRFEKDPSAVDCDGSTEPPVDL